MSKKLSLKKLSLTKIYESSEEEHQKRRRERMNIYFVADKYLNSGDSIEELKRDFEDPNFNSSSVRLFRKDYFSLKERGELDHLLKLVSSRFGN